MCPLAIKIPEDEIRKIYGHSERVYPEECVGALIGKGLTVFEARPMENVYCGTFEARRRFSIDPVALVSLDRELEPKELELIGVYHSHPNYPSNPSKIDASSAWPEFLYIIVSLLDGKVRDLACWKLDSRTRDFSREGMIKV